MSACEGPVRSNEWKKYSLDELHSAVPLPEEHTLFPPPTDEEVVAFRKIDASISLPSAQISSDSLKKIIHFIRNHPHYINYLHNQGGGLIGRDRKGETLPRSIAVTSEGEVIVNCKSLKRKTTIIRGLCKHITFSIDFNHQLHIFATSRITKREDDFSLERYDIYADAEAYASDKLKGKANIVQYRCVFFYEKTDKNGKRVRKQGILMPFYDQFDLREVLDLQRRVNIEDAKFFMIGMLNGLCAIHEAGMVHRDIKLDNIFVNAEIQENGSTALVPYIGDFGFCVDVSDDSILDFSCGTLIYAAPEMLDFGERVGDGILLMEDRRYWKSRLTQKMDVYSMGVVFLMLLNKVPFSGEERSLFEVRTFIDNFEEPLDKKSLDYLVWRMLRPNPDERISSHEAREMLLSLPCFNKNHRPRSRSI